MDEETTIAYVLLFVRPTLRRGAGGQVVTQTDVVRSMVDGWLDRHPEAKAAAMERLKEDAG